LRVSETGITAGTTCAVDRSAQWGYTIIMAIRGEVFSTKVSLPRRTYFFNVKENRMGDLYLNIVESKKEDEGSFERQSLIVFDEDKTAFLQGLDTALKVMNKESGKKKGGPPGKTAFGSGEAKKGYGKKKPHDNNDDFSGKTEKHPPFSSI
jgi:hypothetical protein